MSVKSKNTKKVGDKKEDEYNPKDWCPCGQYDEGEEEVLVVLCDSCDQWWHLKCVGLEGLDKEIAEALPKWKCPRCIMKHLGMGSTIIQETVKTELEKAVPGIVKSVVEATVKSKDFKKTFADIATGRAENMEKKVEKTVENTMHSAIKENQQALLQQAAQKQDAERHEREKRKRNIVVSNLKESSKDTPGARYASDVKKLLKILSPTLTSKEQIITCHRAGGIRENGGPRLLIATLETPQMAEHFHNYGAGHRLEQSDGEKYIWINPDLIKSDRDANYNARKIMRERRAELNGKRTKRPVDKTEEKAEKLVQGPARTNENPKTNNTSITNNDAEETTAAVSNDGNF